MPMWGKDMTFRRHLTIFFLLVDRSGAIRVTEPGGRDDAGLGAGM